VETYEDEQVLICRWELTADHLLAWPKTALKVASVQVALSETHHCLLHTLSSVSLKASGICWFCPHFFWFSPTPFTSWTCLKILSEVDQMMERLPSQLQMSSATTL